MADTIIQRPGGETDVAIRAHPGAGRPQTVQLRLQTEAARGFSVWQKEMPPDLPVTHQGMRIEWFNNFGLKKAGSDEYEAEVPAYTIIVDKGPPDAVLFYYDELSEPQINRLETTEVEGKLQATLDRGDPAVGWGT